MDYGLRIAKTNLTGAYHQQNAAQKNSHTATARITSGKITVNVTIQAPIRK